MVDENTVEALSNGGEALGEAEYGETFVEESIVVHESSPRRGTSWFLVLSGLGFLMAGVALVFAPDIDPRLADIGQAMANVGMLPSAFLVSGVVLFGMGLVARTVGSVAPQKDEPHAFDDSEFMLVADQLATDLAQSQSSLLQISENVTGLEEGQRLLMESLKSQNQAGEGGHNSVFRMAASMDQLNARIEEDLQKLDAQLSSRFLALASSVQEAFDGIATRMEAMGTVAPAQQAPVAQPAPVAQQPVAPPVMPASVLPAEDDQPANAVEDLGSALEEQLSMVSHPMDMGDMGGVSGMDEPAAPMPQPDPVAPLPESMQTSESSLDFFGEVEQRGLGADGPQLGTPGALGDLDSLLPDESIRRALGE